MRRMIIRALLCTFSTCALAATYTNSFVRDGATYVQRGGLTLKDYVITNISPDAIGSALSTNGPDGASIAWTEYGGLNVKTADGPSFDVNSGQFTVGLGGITAASGSISFTGTDEGFTFNGEVIATRTYITNLIEGVTNNLPTGGGITTNDVCAIVTNSTVVWTFSGSGYDPAVYDYMVEGPSEDGDSFLWELYRKQREGGDGEWRFTGEYYGSDTATELTFLYGGVSINITATRTTGQNALGLARLDDLTSLTNSISNTYQTKLPYETNAIPYSAIMDAPNDFDIVRGVPVTNESHTVNLMPTNLVFSVTQGIRFAPALYDYEFTLRPADDLPWNFTWLLPTPDDATAMHPILLASTNDIAAAISTNNPAFVAAVTNCPVVIAAQDAIDLGEFGTFGTLGAALAALAAAVAALKRNKVTSISAASTDAQYPSAKCVWDIVGDVESALAQINGNGGGQS